jgi:hypothetical protein
MLMAEEGRSSELLSYLLLILNATDGGCRLTALLKVAWLASVALQGRQLFSHIHNTDKYKFQAVPINPF